MIMLGILPSDADNDLLPLFRSTAACIAYTSTSSCQRLGFSRICLPSRSLVTKRRRAPRKEQQTTPQSSSPTLPARSLKLSSIFSIIGSCHYTMSALGSHRDTPERVRRRKQGPLTNGFPFSLFRPAFNSIGSVDARSAKWRVTTPNSTLSIKRYLLSNIL